MDTTVDVFTRYGRTGASSRLRHMRYAPALGAAGMDAQYHAFFDDAYIDALYRTGHRSIAAWFRAMCRRLADAVAAGNHLVVEYEMLPFLPAFTDLLLLRKRKFILDFDDDVREKYRKMPGLAEKFEKLMEAADGVIAANHALEQLAREHNGNVMRIPTTVDIASYEKSVPKRPVFTVAWIGTPVTAREHLLPAADMLRKMAAAADFELLVISSEPPPPVKGVRIAFEKWDEKIEGSLLASCHAGIMPLPDTAFARGKSAYKLIQYCAAGLPCIASPVGENAYVVEPGVNGFLVADGDAAANALRTLATNEKQRIRMSAAASEKAKAYDLGKWSAEYAGFVKSTLF
ncbi:MAG: glycosyltransferase [Victivallaceae bacterium]|nr:glycosyltransferase [Victivallaceae bacterium]